MSKKKRLREQAVYAIYLILFLLAEVAEKAGSAVFFLIVAFNFWLWLTDKEKRDMVLFSTFLLGSEAAVLLNLLLILCFSGKSPARLARIHKGAAALLGAVLVISLLCGILRDTLWNVLGYTAFLTLLALTGAAAADMVAPGRFIRLITRFIWIQLAVTALIFLRLGSFDYVDSYYGTLRNAHTFGNWLILALGVLICDALTVQKLSGKELVKTHGLTLSAMAVMLWITDAKILMLCGALGLAAYLGFRRVKKRPLLKFILLLYGAVFAATWILEQETVRELVCRLSPGAARYLYDPAWNGKITYIRGTFFESLKGFRLLTGYGLGQYGSRVANAFAYDAMWRGDSFINRVVAALFEPHSIPEYTRYVSYYTEEFVSAIRWRSAILSYPFNSFTAIIGETGLLGVCSLAYLLDRLFGNKRYAFVVYYFFIACIFDTYLDNVLCVGPAILYLVNARPPETLLSSEKPVAGCAGRIPKKIHYCWFGGKPLPESALRCIESWKRHFPGYEIIRWDESNFDFSACRYAREAYEAGKWAFVSDYARFQILCQQGGLYFDTDVEVIRPFDDIVEAGAFMGCETPDMCNPGLGLGAEPGMALYREILALYHSLRFLNPDGSVNTEPTVVGHVTGVLRNHGFQGNGTIERVRGVNIYPVDYFCPMDYMTYALEITGNTRSIHHYTATWQSAGSRFKIWVQKLIGPRCTRWIQKIKRKIRG